MPTRNPRYTPPLVSKLACRAACSDSMTDTVPQSILPDSEISSPLTVLVDKDGNYVELSDGFCHLVGYTRAELAELKHDDLIAPGTADTATVPGILGSSACGQGLWLLVSKAGTRVLVHYHSLIRSDSRVQIKLELVGAGY
jgi:PAS domain S-box-containing protein